MLRALSVRTTRRAIARSIVDFPAVRKANHKVIKDLAEFKQRDIFHQQLKAAATGSHDKPKLGASEISLKPDDIRLVLKASLATFLLHVEARIAASVGQGFYTIGPCGEELLSIVGLSLHATDPSALHYRHVGTAVMRALRSGRSLDEVVLDRARGYTVSSLDPVTGGRHCAIGGSSYDFFVSSTLASQCCPAVGRAQAIPLAHTLKVPSPFPKDAVSYVSLGDGSANNGHFLSALNLAEYSIYHKIKCPVVFAISDNGISISLKDKGWLQEMINRVAMKRFTADGSDPLDVHAKSEAAIHYSRTYRRPSLLVFKNLSRRFGHASTDRQAAYLSQNDIEGAASRNDLHEFCKLAVESGAVSWNDILSEFEATAAAVERAFDAAANEPKITSREDLVQSNSAPIVHAPNSQPPKLWDYSNHRDQHAHGKGKVVAEVMRKHMTTLFDEALAGHSPAGDHVVYLGEDVRHGGYYLVTDGLAAKYPLKVHDFPPDETALVGAAWGYAQAGLRPVLEIPYAKYLDCASDMFHEICATHWLTNGREAPGLLIRLQGFDKGTFGGNFHTHNSLHIPPGLDVVCYSNGLDYVRGARHLLRQTGQGGRVCMSVDCTELLNRRHLYPELQDGFFLSQFPTSQGDNVAQEMTFEDVVLYQPNDSKARCGAVAKSQVDLSKVSLVIVSYGNGLPTSLITMNNLIEKGVLKAEEVLVVDSPYLTRPPKELEALLTELQQAHYGHGHSAKHAPAVVFADICKEGPAMPFASFVVALQKSGVLPAHWRAVGGTPTYNPLGQLLTFLSTEDIEQAATAALKSGGKK